MRVHAPEAGNSAVVEGAHHGAEAKLATGARFLQWFRPACRGVDVDTLIVEATRARDAILALGRTRLYEFDPALTPRVRLITQF